MTGIPVPLCASDVTLSALETGSSKFGFRVSVDPPDLPLHHLRYHSGRGFIDGMTCSPLDPERRHSAIVEERPALYAGPFMDHFGHFVAECIHRIYARTVFPALRGLPLAFQLGEGREIPERPWLREVLRLCGVEETDIIAVNRDVRFAELHIPQQGRVMAGPSTFDGYAGLLPLSPLEASAGLGAPERIYVSRSDHMFSGSIIGETLIERSLAQAGFTIVYPERMSTSAFVALLSAAKIAVFSEGSALHNLELCGPRDIRVLVIGRRSGTYDRFRFMLDDFTTEWKILGDVEAVVPLDWDPGRERPSWQRSCSYVRLDSVLAEIALFSGVPVPVPTQAEMQNAMRQDLARVVLDERTTRSTTSDERLGALLRQLRRHHAAIEGAWLTAEAG